MLQTSGGLLAAVPKHSSIAALNALHAAGYTDAAIVGSVEADHRQQWQTLQPTTSYLLDIHQLASDDYSYSVWLA